MIVAIIQFIALFLLMLVTGVFFGPWFALHRKLHVFNSEEFMHIVKTMAANLALPMRILMPCCILFLGLSVWLFPQKDALIFYLVITAFILILISLVITISVEVPIVGNITTWTSSTIPINWESIRGRWVKFHVIRTISALLSFFCFSAAIIFEK